MSNCICLPNKEAFVSSSQSKFYPTRNASPTSGKDHSENNLIKYSATITRDIYGVPHIHGSSDADAAFGLAYAQAEDDIKNILATIDLAQAGSGLKRGKEGAITDYLIKALGYRELVERRYETDLSKEVKDVIEGFVA